jgi:hypothetical protein
MDPELKYTNIQLKVPQPKLVNTVSTGLLAKSNAHSFALNSRPWWADLELSGKDIIDEEQIQPTNSSRVSIAIHPTCDCSTCCCYFCCGCPELYTPDEMLINNSKYTICPLTSKVINPILVINNTCEKNNNPLISLASPGTVIADLVLIIPRAIIHICSAKTK